MGNFIDNMPIVKITKSIIGIGSGSNAPPTPVTGIPLENSNPIIFRPRPGVNRGETNNSNSNSNNSNNNTSLIDSFDQDTLIYIIGGAVIFIILLKK